MHCSKCGRELPAEVKFCPHCGARQGPSPPDATAPVERLIGSSRGRNAGPEEELWSGAYSPKAMVGPAIGAALLTAIGAVLAAIAGPAGGLAWGIGVVLVWGAIGLLLAYRRLTVHYRLTTYRLFHDTGLLSRIGNRVEVIDIDDVTVHQGLIERLFGVGTIVIRSSDVTHPELSLRGIEAAKKVADLIDGTRRAERQRRGLHLETI